MKAISIIDDLADSLNKVGKSSFNDFKELKNPGILDSLIDKTYFKEQLKVELTDYLDYLYNDDYHYLKKINLYESNNIFNIFLSSYYIICLYFNNIYAYRDMPMFIKLLIDNLNIEEYSHLGINDIKIKLRETYDISDGYDCNLGKYTFELVPKYKEKYVKYSDYDYLYKPNSVYTEDTTNFFVWSEHKVYENEKYKLSNLPNLQNKVRWVSRVDGDGYGFDVLSFNETNKKEMLIEVKSCKPKNITLTNVELNVMRNCNYYSSEYYIYNYYYDKEENLVKLCKYMYIKDLDKLLDQNGNYYDLNINKYFNSKGKEIIEAYLKKCDVDILNKKLIK